MNKINKPLTMIDDGYDYYSIVHCMCSCGCDQPREDQTSGKCRACLHNQWNENSNCNWNRYQEKVKAGVRFP
jgi:hypothetical protein